MTRRHIWILPDAVAVCGAEPRGSEREVFEYLSLDEALAELNERDPRKCGRCLRTLRRELYERARSGNEQE